MTNKHFILDYETIGQDVFTVPAVNCAYYTFDWDRFTSDNPYTFEELINEIVFAKFDIEDQVKFGYKFKKDDLKWWKDLGPEAMKQLKPSSEDISISHFVLDLDNYLCNTKIKKWWSRSNTFDPILLHRSFKDFSSRERLDFLLPFWLVRDTRTYLDTRFDFKLKVNGFCPMDDKAEWDRVFIQHNPVHDLAADILRIQRVERVINSED